MADEPTPRPPMPERPRQEFKMPRVLSDPSTLADHLAACYAARHGFAPATAHDGFCKAVQRDRALMAQADARFNELQSLHDACQGNIEKRCVLSAAHYDALKAALGK